METFALSMAAIHERAVLSSATIVSGELCVMTFGVLLMQLWLAVSWDSPLKVECNYPLTNKMGNKNCWLCEQ